MCRIPLTPVTWPTRCLICGAAKCNDPHLELTHTIEIEYCEDSDGGANVDNGGDV